MRGPAQRLFKEEGGFTLSEMMVVTMIMTIVLFALYSIFDASIRVFSFGNDKVEAVENARLGIERMTREIRGAYPVDKTATTPLNHVLFTTRASMNTPGLPPSSGTDPYHVRREITFGNDLPTDSPPAPNWKLGDNDEVITYRLRSSADTNNACPTTGDQGVCTLQRITYDASGNAKTPQPVVDFVLPNGLEFQFLKGDTSPILSPSVGSDVQVVRITLKVKAGRDNGEEILTTDVDLRGQGA